MWIYPILVMWNGSVATTSVKKVIWDKVSRKGNGNSGSGNWSGGGIWKFSQSLEGRYGAN